VAAAAVPHFIGRNFDQICFVVEDLDEAKAFWTRALGIENWSTAMDLAKGQTEKEYWGEPGDFEFSCLYGAVGNVVVELARHDGGSSLYKDWLDEGGNGPHHVGFLLADSEEYARACAVLSDYGLTKAMGGFSHFPGGECRWSYWDTRQWLGCYAELYYLDGAAALEGMAQVKAGEVINLTGS
jgi:catechol 2,3-dioxygenase-like lactoylglutathione lyase family enzyme